MYFKLTYEVITYSTYHAALTRSNFHLIRLTPTPPNATPTYLRHLVRVPNTLRHLLRFLPILPIVRILPSTLLTIRLLTTAMWWRPGPGSDKRFIVS